MGIQGLLPFLEKATKPCHISEFRGATVVVDTYCWLHRGATTCAIQLIQGEDTKLYVNYCLRYIKMLQSFDIRPILVFDGRNLPAKAGTEAKRRESRSKAKSKAAELLRQGKTEEARCYLKASVNITPEMASALIKECHKINVDCIVAPYESDAQLAFFSLKGIAEIVITEDSDLILFGCTKILYKLDLQGCCYLVDAEKINTAVNIRPDRFSFDKFRHMCILSGCDYADSLQGIGLKKAEKFIALTDETDPEKFLDKIPRYLKMNKIEITEEYKRKFMLADATFKHQIVFDPFKKKLVPLIDPQVTGTNPSYCANAGEIYDHDKAYQVALGNLHPSSFKKLNDWDPKKANLTNKSIWCEGSYVRSISRKEQKQKQKDSFLNFFNKNKENSIEVDDTQIRMEEDSIIKKEIEFYLKPVPKQEIVSVEIDEIVDKQDEKISPVIKKNPFIKKISKFQRTQVDSSVLVKSRYFCPKDKEVQETSLDNDCKDESTDLIETSIKEEEGSIILELDEVSPISQASVPEEKLSKLEIEESNSVLKIKNEGAPMRYFSSTKESVVDNDSCAKRKIKTGPCRSVGLKRMKPQGQQSISSFFEKFKKPP